MFITKLEKNNQERLTKDSATVNKKDDKDYKKQHRPERILNQSDYQPKKFNLKFNPPIIILEYITPSSGKLYTHNIRIKNLMPNSDMEKVIKQIYEKHNMYLDSQKVKIAQIISNKTN